MITRSAKKSETIEIRLSHETKSAFMAHCQAEGRTASQALRHFIDNRIEPRSAPRRVRASWRIVLALACGAAFGAGAAAPSLAHATQTSRAAFDHLDRNHDGVVSFDEFRRH